MKKVCLIILALLLIGTCASVYILKQPHTSTITVLIGGDVMFDRVVRVNAEKNGYPSLLAGVSKLFHSADISVANLEGPVTTHSSRTVLSDGSYTGSFTFTFATTSAIALRDAGIDLVSLSNNHTSNFGREGVNGTRDWLDQAGVEWFGDPSNIVSSSTEKIICKKTICVAFVGYHEFEPGFETTLAHIRRLTAQGYPVIVMPHWGEEYLPIAPVRIVEKARAFVEAGAFAVIGSHPHVIQNKEWIGNVPIIYSLGNLLFDQYFSPEVMKGNIAELTISKDETGVHIDTVRLYTVSNESKRGPVIVGEPVEFLR